MKNQVWTPDMKEFAKPKGNEEAVAWTWYHMRRQAAGAFSPTQQFFNVAKGGTDGSVSATSIETNMEKASSITAPKRFMITAISVNIKGETTAGGVVEAATTKETNNSIQQAIDNLTLTFFISDKKYLELPLEYLPAAAGLYGFVGTAEAASTASGAVTNGVPSNQNGYGVLLPLPFEIAFSAVLDAPKTFTTTGALRVTVAIDGILIRPSQ